jgi:integrase
LYPTDETCHLTVVYRRPHDQKKTAVGLIPKTEGQAAETLGAFWEAYFARRREVKPATLINWGHTRRNLLAFFGPDKLLREVTVAEARDFERLKTTARENRYGDSKKDEPLGAATIRKRISNAKLFFGDALERGLIDANPFAKLKGASVSNAARQFYITREMTAKVLDACPDSQWRLVVALCRYGGLRCPSEMVGLQLADVDWNAGRVRVTSPKTEHHEGKGERFIPLFPEMRPYLEAVWHEAPVGVTHFVTRYRDATQNLRTTFLKIIRRAGLKPWPKLFQNLRSSRQTELEESYPSHVVCAWMGNSRAVAQKHYLQVTDEHFAKAAQNPAQSAHATDRMEPQSPMAAHEQTLVLPGFASGRDYLPLRPVGDEGLEPPTLSV